MSRICDWIESIADGPTVQKYMHVISRSIRGLGNVSLELFRAHFIILVVVVYGITTLLTFCSFGIILPYEQWYQPRLLLLVYTIIGVFFFTNIMFHYYKARTLPPLYTPGVSIHCVLPNYRIFDDTAPQDRWCIKCEHFKTIRTHHCGICQRCILGMDHHCIWINQCVGSHNHRHFFLFIAYLSLATLLIVVAGFNTVYDHVFHATAERTYCSAEIDYAPLQEFICRYDGFAQNAVIFTYLLSALLMLLVGFLTGWNIFLISRGFTYIDYLHWDNVAGNSNYRNPLNQGFRQNWINFLGLRRNRSFLCHVVLPSSHPAFLFEEEQDAFRTDTVVV